LKKPTFTMPTEIAALNLRHKLGEILDAVANKRERFLVKRAGIPVAILLSVADYHDLEDLVDTWYEQQDPTFQESLVKARQEIKAGKVATLEDLSHDLQVKERRGKKRS
jgi:PHD/YefM family antitoxin component YafN of YafNO toxin-antitoxin module